MFGWITSSVDGNKQYDTLSDLVMRGRRLRDGNKILFVMILILLLLVYCTWIAPLFEEEGLTNSAVMKTLQTKQFEDGNRYFSETLQSYNKGDRNSTTTLNLSHAVQGVIVTVMQTTIATDEPRAAGGFKYRAESSYKVTLNIPQLILFLTVLTVAAGFMLYFMPSKVPPAQLRLEEEILNQFFALDAIEERPGHLPPDVLIERMLASFHRFVRALGTPTHGSTGIEIRNEYDVQHLLHALLRLHFENVKREEQAPSIAGRSSRPDFMLPELGLAIEVKMGMADGVLADQLINDIARYRAHPDCEKILFFVYDPNAQVQNPVLLYRDLCKIAGAMPISMVVSPNN